jgi:hypothetical protein
MRAQRPPKLDAVAEALPFEDGYFEASMGTFTVHQWPDLDAGLAELRRVTTGPMVILTCDPDTLDRFWLNEYCPEVISTEARRYPPIRRSADGLGARSEGHPAPIPLHCTDRFNQTYYGRPKGLLDLGARLACSAWSFVGAGAVTRFERTPCNLGGYRYWFDCPGKHSEGRVSKLVEGLQGQ